MLTPLRAIRKHCIECHGNQRSMVEGCSDTECHLFPYRMGKNPTLQAIARERKNAGLVKFQKKK